MGGGRIVVGIIGTASAEVALRYAFDEAERRGTEVAAVAAGPASPDEDVLVGDAVRRWAEKHPAVGFTYEPRRAVDAVVTLAAASRHAGLMVVQDAAEPHTAAMVAALARRAHCALVTVPGPALTVPGPARTAAIGRTGCGKTRGAGSFRAVHGGAPRPR